MSGGMSVAVVEWDLEYEVAVELDNGEVVRATGATMPEALRNLADAIDAKAAVA